MKMKKVRKSCLFVFDLIEYAQGKSLAKLNSRILVYIIQTYTCHGHVDEISDFCRKRDIQPMV